MRRLAILALLLAPSIPRPSGACSPLPTHGAKHNLDAAYITDTTPPSAVTASAIITRDESDGPSAGCNTADCGSDGAAVILSVDATDAGTESYLLGYQLRVVGGQPPGYLDLPDATYTSMGGEFRLQFDETERSFTFDLEVRAVDLNGNLGPATVITISEPA